MEVRQANKLETKDTKTSQSIQMRKDNVLYDDYANMSDKDVAELRAKRNKTRISTSGQMLQTFIPEEFKKPNLEYQWKIDDPINLKKLMAEGWVVVSDEKLATLKGGSTTSVVKIPSGSTNTHGEPEYLVLMAIHKSLYEDDVLAQKQRIKDLNDQIDNGTAIMKQSASDSTDGLEVKEVKIE